MQRPGMIALATSRIAADRVNLVGNCPVIDYGARLAVPSVFAFAKNYIFFHATRTCAELRRENPRMLLMPKGRHVLLQVDSFMQGGMENVVIDLALSLQDTGFKVTIGNLGRSGYAIKAARERGLNVESFPNGLSEEDYVGWLRREKVAIVNAHYSIFGAESCNRAGIPFIETIHNAYVWLDSQSIEKYREADRYISSYICVSNTAALYADVVLGLDVSKMRVIPNGIDVDSINAAQFSRNRSALRMQWGVDESAPVYLNVASILPAKAQLALVKAFELVRDQRPGALLVLLGGAMDESYRDTVVDAIQHANLQESVIVAGHREDVNKYYHAADVFVLPSYWEGWSLSLGEAMANGLPCVVTDVGSAYEFEGHPRVEVVRPPFGDVTALRFDNIASHVYKEDASFIKDLAEAMLRAAKVARGQIDVDFAARLDRRIAYVRYAEIFGGGRTDGHRFALPNSGPNEPTGHGMWRGGAPNAGQSMGRAHAG